jgi:uncharacterized protein YkwD
MRKALTLVLLISLALLLIPAVAQAITPTSAEKKVVRLVNKERVKRGLAPLRLKASLLRAARAHSRQLARRGVLTHTSANGDGVARRLIRHGFKRRGYRYWTVGENIARASSGSLLSTPVGAMSLWMASPAHRRVILKRSVRNVGVGIARSDGGQRYFTLDVGRRVR